MQHANGGREPEAASSQDRHSVPAHWLSTAFDIATIGACRRALRLLISTVVAYVILAGSFGFAQNSVVHVSQLSHTAWRLRDGALPGMPTMVTQTKDGYIWLGTQLGLYRFDGQRFVKVPLPSNSTPMINALLADRDGSLWVGTFGALFHESAGQVKEVVHGPRIEQLLQSSSGEIWAALARRGNPACVLQSEHFVCWAASALIYGITIGQDDQGGIWASDKNVLEHRERGVVVPQSTAEKLLTRNVNVLSGNGRGTMWASTHMSGKLPTLLSLAGGIWKAAPALPGVTRSTNVQPILDDREGATWVGTSDQGLYRINGSQIDRFNRADGLSADDVRDIFEDAEGSIWVTTSAGLDQFHRSLVDTWSTREGLTTDSVSAILADHLGRIWMGNEGGLDMLENGQIRSYRPENGLPGQTVAALAEDHLGRLWVGVDNDLYLFDGGRFHKVLGPDKKPVGLVVLMREDLTGRMWVRASNQGPLIFSAKGVRKVAWPAGVGVTAMEPDAEGGMWLGARGQPPVHVPAGVETVDSSAKIVGRSPYNGFLQVEGDMIASLPEGLSVVRDGKTYVLDQHNGLVFDSMVNAVRSHFGDIFVGTGIGYLEIPKQEFARWLQDPTAKIKSRLIDASDGALPGAATFMPNSFVAPNGDLWFASDRFPQRIDPKQLAFRHDPPNVVLETLTVDGKTITLTGKNTLPAGTQNIDITYAALSYLHPQHIQYRYRLQGFDKGWQEAGTRREAIYTNLPPGTYTFQVCASDGSGEWTTATAAFQFSVAPHFYQRTWFKLLVVCLAICLLWAAYLTRIRYLSREANARFFERLSERERIARDLHDTFFQGMQGILLRFQTGTSALRSDEPVRPVFEEILKQSDQVMLEGRELVLDLREKASEDRDLEQAFGTVCEELSRMFPISYRIIRQGQARTIVPLVRKELFFIGREALMNAFQHSGAKTIEVELSFQIRTIGLRIRDDGSGIDADVQLSGSRRGHFGLTGMRERAKMIGATLKVWSQVGAGTEVDIQVPSAIALGSRETHWSWLAKLRDTQV